MSRSGHPHVHQDYLARVRYSNALPPPPFYPKFLDIPNTGLSSGIYTSSNYASRLAREQPLNIEPDAELGMPIDLVGIEGVFEDKEDKIMFSDDATPLHPRDRELLRPLNALGKPVASTNAVSFLRRTEYISGTSAVNKAAAGKNAVLRQGGNVNRAKKLPGANKDDPISILRGIVKGFDIANPHDTYRGEDSQKNLRGAPITDAENKAWAEPVHPTKKSLTLLDEYPVLPDLDSLPDTGNYMLLKYQTNPSDISSHYDPRLDVALIRPLAQTADEEAIFEEKMALAQTDPLSVKPLPEYRYDVLMPENPSSVSRIKRKFSTEDPENDDEELYDYDNPDSGRRAFRYKRLRQYETYQQAGNADDAWNDSVGLVLNDGESGGRLARGAYIYPIVQRTSIRPIRPKTLKQIARGRTEEVEEDRVDFIELCARDLNENEVERIGEYRGKLDTA
jgi:RNA polymerase II-associated factor 1